MARAINQSLIYLNLQTLNAHISILPHLGPLALLIFGQYSMDRV